MTRSKGRHKHGLVNAPFAVAGFLQELQLHRGARVCAGIVLPVSCHVIGNLRVVGPLSW